MNPTSLFEVAVQYGLPTVLLFLVGWAYYREVRGRIDDAKIYFDRMAKAQEVLGAIAEKLGDETQVRELTRELLKAAEQLKASTEEIKQRERDALRDTGAARQRPGGVR